MVVNGRSDSKSLFRYQAKHTPFFNVEISGVIYIEIKVV